MDFKNIRLEIEKSLYERALNISAVRAITLSELVNEAMQIVVERDQNLLEIVSPERPLATWLSKEAYTHVLTATPHSAEFGGWNAPNQDHGLRLRQQYELFHNYLSKNLYRTGRSKRTIPGVTFFENLTRSGDPTYWHVHGLLTIADDYCDERLKRKAVGTWRRVFGAGGSIDLKRLDSDLGGVAGAADYLTKHDHRDGIEPLFYSTPSPSTQRQDP